MTLSIQEDWFLEAFSADLVPHLSSTRTLAYSRQRDQIKEMVDVLLGCPMAADYFQRFANHSPTHSSHGARVGEMFTALITQKELIAALDYHTAHGGELHDIGKLYVRKKVLEGGALTEPEKKEMLAHNELSVRVLRLMEDYFPKCSTLYPLHHEYPRSETTRRQKERRSLIIQLPLEIDYRRRTERRKEERRLVLSPGLEQAGKLLRIADIYDALSSKRHYKASWPKEQVRAELLKQFSDNAADIDFLIENFPGPR